MSIIQKLKGEGALVLYHDYRRGDTIDKSDNGNDGVLTDTYWNRNGVSFPAGSSEVRVTDSAELQLTEGTLVVFGDFHTQVDSRLISKRDTGTNYDWYITATAIALYDGSAVRSLNIDITGGKYLALNMLNGTAIGKIYKDGVLAGSLSDTSTITASDDVLAIGNISSGAKNVPFPLKAALIVNRQLTDTEHAELFAELEAMTFDTRVTSRPKANLKVDPSEAGLVGGYNMIAQGATVVDQSSNGNDGTIVKGVFHKNTPLGDALNFDGSTGYINVTSSPVFASADNTISFWFQCDDVNSPAIQGVITNGSTGTDRQTLNMLSSALTYVYGDGSTTYSLASATLQDDALYHAVITREVSGGDTTVKIYIDGGTPVSRTDTTTPDVTDTSLLIGWLNSTRFYNGSMANIKLYNEAKDAAWVANEYQKGKQALFKTEYGANQSKANVTAGFLENTPVTAYSGTWKITTDTINGVNIKVLDCIASGLCYIPTSLFHQTPTEAGHGKWEWWGSHADASTTQFLFIASFNGPRSDPDQNGYGLRILPNESVLLSKITVGGILGNLFSTAASYINNLQWYKYTIERSNAGVFTCYIDDVLIDPSAGANPVTDTLYTTSNYIVMDLDTGDKVAWASEDGNIGITKSLTI